MCFTSSFCCSRSGRSRQIFRKAQTVIGVSLMYSVGGAAFFPSPSSWNTRTRAPAWMTGVSQDIFANFLCFCWNMAGGGTILLLHSTTGMPHKCPGAPIPHAHLINLSSASAAAICNSSRFDHINSPVLGSCSSNITSNGSNACATAVSSVNVSQVVASSFRWAESVCSEVTRLQQGTFMTDATWLANSPTQLKPSLLSNCNTSSPVIEMIRTMGL